MQPYTELLNAIPPPIAVEVANARHAAGLTQTQAAAILGTYQPRWADYESGKVALPVQRWALFLLLTDQHPTLTLRRRSG